MINAFTLRADKNAYYVWFMQTTCKKTILFQKMLVCKENFLLWKFYVRNEVKKKRCELWSSNAHLESFPPRVMTLFVQLVRSHSASWNYWSWIKTNAHFIYSYTYPSDISDRTERNERDYELYIWWFVCFWHVV